MMVYQYFGRLAALYHRSQTVNALQRIEVKTHYSVCIGQHTPHSFRIARCYHDLLKSGQKIECGSRSVGRYHNCRFAHPAQYMAQSELRPQSITVGSHVAGYHKLRPFGYEFCELLYIRYVNRAL